MKKFKLLLLGVLACQLASQAQEVHTKKAKVYKVTITQVDGTVAKGSISSVGEEALSILPGKKAPSSALQTMRQVNYESISVMKVQRKGSAGRGALIGGLVGIATGVIVGFVSGDDPEQPYYTAGQDPSGIGNVFVAMNNAFAMSAGEKATFYGIGLGTMGACVGAIIGAVAKKTFVIGGKKDAYDIMRGTVLEMTYGKPPAK